MMFLFITAFNFACKITTFFRIMQILKAVSNIFSIHAIFSHFLGKIAFYCKNIWSFRKFVVSLRVLTKIFIPYAVGKHVF